MKVLLKNIKYKKVDKTHSYWILNFVDCHGNLVETIDMPKLSSSVDFRYQTYGILAACNCYDLLRIFTNSPNLLKVYIPKDDSNKVEYIKNSHNAIFSFKEDKYVLEHNHNILKIAHKHPNELSGQIESITSESGTFAISIATENFKRTFLTGQVYYGFGTPLNEHINLNEKHELLAADMFKTFIEAILKLYQVDDLLGLAKTEYVEYPIVDLEYDEQGKPQYLGCEETGIYLQINENSYAIEDRGGKKEEGNKLKLNN